jgi:hypothetical protein
MEREKFLQENDRLRWEIYHLRRNLRDCDDKKLLKDLHKQMSIAKKQKKSVRDKLSTMPKEKKKIKI